MLRFKTFMDRFVKALPDANVEKSPKDAYFIVEFWDRDLAVWHSALSVVGFGPKPDQLRYNCSRPHNNNFLYEDYWYIDQVVRGSGLIGRKLIVRIKHI